MANWSTTLMAFARSRWRTIEGDGIVVLTVKGGRIDLTPEEADKLADHLTATADQSRQPASVQTQRQRRRVRLFFVDGCKGLYERHDKTYLTRRRRGGDGGSDGSVTGGGVRSA